MMRKISENILGVALLLSAMVGAYYISSYYSVKKELSATQHNLENLLFSQEVSWQILLRNDLRSLKNLTNGEKVEIFTLSDEPVLAMFISEDICTPCLERDLKLFTNTHSPFKKIIVGSEVNVQYLKNLNSVYQIETFLLSQKAVYDLPFFVFYEPSADNVLVVPSLKDSLPSIEPFFKILNQFGSKS